MTFAHFVRRIRIYDVKTLMNRGLEERRLNNVKILESIVKTVYGVWPSEFRFAGT